MTDIHLDYLAFTARNCRCSLISRTANECAVGINNGGSQAWEAAMFSARTAVSFVLNKRIAGIFGCQKSSSFATSTAERKGMVR